MFLFCLPGYPLFSSHQNVLLPHFLFIFYHFKKYVFIWPHRVLAAVCGIFSCSMWDLVPCPGIEPELPALHAGVLAIGPPRKSLIFHLCPSFLPPPPPTVITLQASMPCSTVTSSGSCLLVFRRKHRAPRLLKSSSMETES